MPTKGDGGSLTSFIIGEKIYPADWIYSIDSTVQRRYLTREEKLDPKNIKKVIFNRPATIVIFKDDTKIVVKAHNEDFDEEKGFLMAMSRVMFESRAEFNRIIDKGIEESYK